MIVIFSSQQLVALNINVLQYFNIVCNIYHAAVSCNIYPQVSLIEMHFLIALQELKEVVVEVEEEEFMVNQVKLIVYLRVVDGHLQIGLPKDLHLMRVLIGTDRLISNSHILSRKLPTQRS